MIGFIIGVLTMAVVFLLYDKFKPSVQANIDGKTEEEKRRDKEFEDHYNNMMNYSAEKAYSGGKLNAN